MLDVTEDEAEDLLRLLAEEINVLADEGRIEGRISDREKRLNALYEKIQAAK